MKLRKNLSPLLFLIAIFGITAGVIAGNMFKSNHQPTQAASSNITVVDNDQTIEQDQSTNQLIVTRTSTVTVYNPDALYGYTLSARLAQDTVPTSQVTIDSNNSTLCTSENTCILTTTPQPILSVTTNAATETSGDSTTFAITITIPAGANPGDYLLDIEYTEESLPYAGLVDGLNIQDVTKDMCDATPSGTLVNLKDTRDDKYYRIKKMVDGNCWMVDNLAYDINSASAEDKPAFDPVPVKNPSSSVTTRAQYIENSTAYNIPNNNSPTPTYLYNFCAALADTSASCSASRATNTYNTVTNGAVNTTGTATSQPEVQGICPAPFRLPKGGPSANPAFNGSNMEAALASTANEYVKLDIMMGGNGTNREDATRFSLWTGTSISADNNWFGVYSGYYNSGFSERGGRGVWWSSTASDGSIVSNMRLIQPPPAVNPSNASNKSYAYAVRCLL